MIAATLLAGCAPQAIVDVPSANQDDRIRFLVLHFTDENFERSLDLLTRPHPNPVSAHYLVTRAGEYGRAAPTVLRLVDESRRAWHAGPSRWQGHEPLNGESIGIEIVYEPKCPARVPGASPWDADAACDYPPWPANQIDAVTRLARDILARHPEIDPTRVVGHADVQPENKTDPGPRFPWRRLAAAGVGAWYDGADVERWRAYFAQHPPQRTLVLDALTAYGYGIEAGNERRAREVVCAFQSHFLPGHRSGEADADTAAALFALLGEHRPEAFASFASRLPGAPLPPGAADSAN
jgi:N-acetylmuramoyl-L-alanine amidase